MTDKLLDIDNDETVRLSVSEAQELGEKALLKLGFTPEEASIVATHLVDASMWGYEFAGLPRILVIAERPELKKPRTPVSIVRETAVSALLDGGNNVGYISLLRAVEVAIEKVRKSGVAVIGLRNSWFSGRNAYYMEKIARAGFAAIYTAQQHADCRAARRRSQDPGHQSHGDRATGKGEPFYLRHGYGFRDVG